MTYKNNTVEFNLDTTIEVVNEILNTVDALVFNEGNEYAAHMVEFATRYSIMVFCSNIQFEYEDVNELYSEILFSSVWDDFMNSSVETLNKISILTNIIKDYINAKLQSLNSFSYFAEQFLDIVACIAESDNINIDFSKIDSDTVKSIKDHSVAIKNAITKK